MVEQVNIDQEENKSPLLVNIINFKAVRYVNYYNIQLTSLLNNETGFIEKRFSQFYQLNEALKAKGFQNLPRLPPKTILPVRSQDGLERRRQDLNNYIRELVYRKETVNSKDLISFLELDKFFPEFLYTKPQLVEKIQMYQNFYVKFCIFLKENSLFVLGQNDKSRKNSKIEIFAFRSTELVKDSYIIRRKGHEIDTVLDRSNSFGGCLGGRIPNSHREERKQSFEDEIQDIKKVEKLLEFIMDGQLRAMTYCEEVNILSLALKDGKIQNFTINVTIEKNQNSDEEKEKESDDDLSTERHYKKRKGSIRIKSEGTFLVRKAFQQVESDSLLEPANPEGQRSYSQKQRESEDLIKNQYEVDMNSETQRIEFRRHSTIQAHKGEILDAVLDDQRMFLYSSGRDKKLVILDISEKQILNSIKTANATIKCLFIDQQMKRLYASSLEGQVFLFDISGIVPLVLHSFTFENQEFGYVRKIDADIDKNMLFCLCKNSQVIYIQIDSKQERKSTLIDTITPQNEEEKIQTFNWLSRMVCYLEGSDKGKLRVKDVQNGGECMFVLSTDFSDKITSVHYNKERNIIFVGSKDGRFRIWKIPKDWRNKQIQDLEKKLEFSRKENLRNRSQRQQNK